jgi:hypothetical protein
MSVIESLFRTITCDTCGKSVTFDPKDPQSALEENPWIKTVRIVQRIADGRNFCYDSDECELKSVAAGQHNPEEPKKVVAFPGGAQAIAQAAAAAKAQEESNRALKSGSPVTLHGG